MGRSDEFEYGRTGSLPAHEFIERFDPHQYYENWANVAEDPDFHLGGDDEWPVADLHADVEKHGILNPVDVEDGVVKDGHHRVITALRTGKPVPYREWV